MTTDEIITLQGTAFWEAFFAAERNQVLIYEAKKRACLWETCACCALKNERKGNAGIHRLPKSDVLLNMGCWFCANIQSDDFDRAKKQYAEIQLIVNAENALVPV